MSNLGRAKLPLLGGALVVASSLTLHASRDEWAYQPSAQPAPATTPAPSPNERHARESHSRGSSDTAPPATTAARAASAAPERVVIDPANALSGPADVLVPPEIRIDVTIARGEDPGDAPLIPPTMEAPVVVAPRGTLPPSDAPLTPPVLVIEDPGSAP